MSSSGTTPSAMSWVSSAPSRNGLPPVTAWQACANAGARGRQPLSDQRLGRDRPERARSHGRLGRAGQQLRQQLRRRRRLAHADRAQHPDRELLQRARQQRQPPQRRRIGPMHIVDEQNCRTALAEVADQPHQPAGRGVHRIARGGGSAPLGRERALRQPGRSDRQLIPLRPGSQRLEQLPRHPPRGVLLERAAARPQQRRAVHTRSPPGRPEQCRLANARRSLNDDHTPGPRTSCGNSPGQLPQLRIPIQQHPHRYEPYLPSLVTARGQRKDRGGLHDALTVAASPIIALR